VQPLAKADDSVLWSRLLAMAYERDHELGATLTTFRELGRRLVRNDGRVELMPAGESDEAEYRRDREFLLPHAPLLVELLQEVSIEQT